MPLTVAVIGDRGIPARYGGFSTLVEEMSTRLVQTHDMAVTVYCRRRYYTEPVDEYRGVRLVHLPAPGGKYGESLVHTGLSVIHGMTGRFDVVFMIDPGNAPFLPLLRARGYPVAVHTDGLGWKRRKWGPLARGYYRWTEGVAARWATRLVTDARAMQDYYRSQYHVDSTFIPYGSQVGDPPTTTALDAFGLQPGSYYLVVTRIEPDNNTDLIVREYRRSGVRRPLVVVGSAAYPSDFSRALEREQDDHVRLVGAVYDSGALNGLYANSYAYLHGHEVGGTNPSLLRAMHAARPCVCLDIVYHREVLGEAGMFFDRAPGSLASILRDLEGGSDRTDRIGALGAARAAGRYRWDAVASAYAALFREMHRAQTGVGAALASEFYKPGDFATGSDSSTVND